MQIIRNSIKTAIYLTLALTVTVSFTAHAQRVQPMVFELAPIGPKSSKSLRVENTQQQDLIIEVVASKISMDDLGNEILTPADDDFLIFPPQTRIPTGKTQLIKVKYIGDLELKNSIAYRVSVKQLPVTLKKEGATGIGMAINFHTLLNVSPPKSTSKLSIEKIENTANDHWLLTLKNTGNRFVRLSTTSWKIEDIDNKTETIILKKKAIGDITEKNLILPNKVLKLTIPAIKGFDPKRTKITVIDS